MSCRRRTRQLLDQLRFTEELDASAASALTHLQWCDACQEEVAIDRALTIRLRGVLRDRVAGAAPSPAAWDAIRAQTVDVPRVARGFDLRALLVRGLQMVMAGDDGPAEGETTVAGIIARPEWWGTGTVRMLA